MARDIGEWLDGLGLGKYADVFVEHEVDLEALPELTNADVILFGHFASARGHDANQLETDN